LESATPLGLEKLIADDDDVIKDVTLDSETVVEEICKMVELADEERTDDSEDLLDDAINELADDIATAELALFKFELDPPPQAVNTSNAIIRSAWIFMNADI
jgi:hypothetical protein